VLESGVTVGNSGVVIVSARRSCCTPTNSPKPGGEVQHQVAELDIARNAWRPGVLPSAMRALRAGGTKLAAVPDPVAIPVPLELPGHPVAIYTPGHTPGHTCFYLPEAGVVITGDTLVTGHPTSRRDGPQLLMPMFDHDRAGVLSSLDTLAGLPAEILVPGHCPTWRGPIADATEQARASA
jgi:glyoxylase-like metal-dependent hydrolase (beta-lactamase superfamily II)